MYVILKDEHGCLACQGDVTIVGVHPLHPQGLVDKLNALADAWTEYYIEEVTDLSKYSREEAFEIAQQK